MLLSICMEGVSLGNNTANNIVSNLNAYSNAVNKPVQKYMDKSTDLLKSSENINTSPVDIYNDYNEKKNDMVAVVVANTRHTDKRPSGALIGGAFGLFEVGLFSGIYSLTKVFPILKKSKAINYFANKIDSWIQIAKELHPERTLARNVFTGVFMKSLYLIGSGLVVGAVTDIYKKIKSTNVNGKISKNKQGHLNDKGFVAALNSMNTTEEGKNIINNSIIKNNDKSITVMFRGIGKEYNISKQEMKDASKAYYAISDKNGKVKSFEKKYCKADGDLLAFELAYEKFVKDVEDGNIVKNYKHPEYVYNSFINEDGKIQNSTVEQGYFILTGDLPKSININKPSENAIKDIYSKISLNRELLKLPYSSNQSSIAIKLKADEGDNAVVYNKRNRRKRLNVANYYIVKEVNGNFVTLCNSAVSKEKVVVPIDQILKHATEYSSVLNKE